MLAIADTDAALDEKRRELDDSHAVYSYSRHSSTQLSRDSLNSSRG